ncbi:hypothetical protein [Conexibacter sp. CPCC 206217]|uniref:hypothetical protein n=1 Tax=Conexibacter sp. CPCC 206217 TaxID=3064574 RepID=UPI0027216A03|nr:hypothetical protein [Conexibacter sp. CPCC 206217]MDO8213890.1 hypothetical protein [Conexibacter sp. CPCC 206217]
MPHQITRAERHDLRRNVLIALSGICEDSALAIQNDSWELARELRPKYDSLMDALDRLGWGEGTDPLAKTFEAPDRDVLLLLAGTSVTAAALLAFTPEA